MIEGGINDRWYKITEKIRTLYKDREDPKTREQIKKACLHLISMSKTMIHEYQTNEERNKEDIEKAKYRLEDYKTLAIGEDGAAKMFQRIIQETEEQIKEWERPSAIKNVNLPIHLGYDKLFQIYLDDCAYKEAIELAEKAKSEGWAGEWDKKIVKANRELGKWIK
jgi:hypothetical protein